MSNQLTILFLFEGKTISIQASSDEKFVQTIFKFYQKIGPKYIEGIKFFFNSQELKPTNLITLEELNMSDMSKIDVKKYTGSSITITFRNEENVKHIEAYLNEEFGNLVKKYYNIMKFGEKIKLNFYFNSIKLKDYNKTLVDYKIKDKAIIDVKICENSDFGNFIVGTNQKNKESLEKLNKEKERNEILLEENEKIQKKNNNNKVISKHIPDIHVIFQKYGENDIIMYSSLDEKVSELIKKYKNKIGINKESSDKLFFISNYLPYKKKLNYQSDNSTLDKIGIKDGSKIIVVEKISGVLNILFLFEEQIIHIPAFSDEMFAEIVLKFYQKIEYGYKEELKFLYNSQIIKIDNCKSLIELGLHDMSEITVILNEIIIDGRCLNKNKINNVKIIFKNHCRNDLFLYCSLDNKVVDLLNRYKSLLMLESSNIRFFSNWKELNSHNYNLTLEELGIKNDSIIDAIESAIIGGGPDYYKVINIKFLKLSNNNCKYNNVNQDIIGILKLCLLKEVSQKISDDKLNQLSDIFYYLMELLKRNYLKENPYDLAQNIKDVLDKITGNNIINFSNYVEEILDLNQLNKILTLLNKEDLKEMLDIKNRLSRYNKYMIYLIKNSKNQKEKVI